MRDDWERVRTDVYYIQFDQLYFFSLRNSLFSPTLVPSNMLVDPQDEGPFSLTFEVLRPVKLSLSQLKKKHSVLIG